MAFMAPALPFIMAAGSAASAIGSISAGNSQAAIGSYDAQVAQANAAQAESAATSNAQQVEQQAHAKMGQAAAAYGAGGVDMTGSALSVMNEQAIQGELSKQLTLYQGKLQSAQDTNQGAIAEAQGAAAQTAGYIGAGSTLLTGAAGATKSAIDVGLIKAPKTGTSPMSG